LLSLKSICRDVKIQSRIFESQSTMIAIAAQSQNNVGDYILQLKYILIKDYKID